MLDQLHTLHFSIHGGGDGLSGGIGLLSAVLDTIGGWVSSPPDDVFAAILPGVAGLVNFHPLVVHFPIALFTLFVLTEAVNIGFKREDFSRFASGLLYLGTLFAALTVMLGFVAAETVPHDEAVHEIMENHEHLGVSVLLLSSVLAVWRYTAKQGLQAGGLHFYRLLTAILAILLIFTADLGGLMVYGHGVAVVPVQIEHADADEEHHHH